MGLWISRMCGSKQDRKQGRARPLQGADNSTRLPQERDDMSSRPMTTTFSYTAKGKDQAVLKKASEIAEGKGPQPVGYTEVICGVTINWIEPLRGLGGDPRPSKEVKLDKIGCDAGNNPPVRALYPQIPPPAEPRI